MRVRVDSVEPTPEDHHLEGDPRWNAAARERIPELAGAGAAPVAVDLRIYRVGSRVSLGASGSGLLLEGELRCTLELECARCLARYGAPLCEDFRLLLEPIGRRAPPDREAARALIDAGLWLSDELDMGWFRGTEIDLSAFLLELVALAIPAQPLCRKSCRGLCPHCGADRNREACACDPRREPSAAPQLRGLGRSAHPIEENSLGRTEAPHVKEPQR